MTLSFVWLVTLAASMCFASSMSESASQEQDGRACVIDCTTAFYTCGTLKNFTYVKVFCAPRGEACLAGCAQAYNVTVNVTVQDLISAQESLANATCNDITEGFDCVLRQCVAPHMDCSSSCGKKFGAWNPLNISACTSALSICHSGCMNVSGFDERMKCLETCYSNRTSCYWYIRNEQSTNYDTCEQTCDVLQDVCASAQCGPCGKCAHTCSGDEQKCWKRCDNTTLFPPLGQHVECIEGCGANKVSCLGRCQNNDILRPTNHPVKPVNEACVKDCVLGGMSCLGIHAGSNITDALHEATSGERFLQCSDMVKNCFTACAAVSPFTPPSTTSLPPARRLFLSRATCFDNVNNVKTTCSDNQWCMRGNMGSQIIQACDKMDLCASWSKPTECCKVETGGTTMMKLYCSESGFENKPSAADFEDDACNDVCKVSEVNSFTPPSTTSLPPARRLFLSRSSVV